MKDTFDFCSIVELVKFYRTGYKKCFDCYLFVDLPKISPNRYPQKVIDCISSTISTP